MWKYVQRSRGTRLRAVIALFGALSAIAAIANCASFSGNSSPPDTNADGSALDASTDASSIVDAGGDAPDVPDANALAIQLAVGVDHACALTGAGAVFCWGLNNVGQIGNGMKNNIVLSPTMPGGLSGGVASIAAGYSDSCALMAGDAGIVQCWGGNGAGQLNDSGVDVSTPIPIALPGPATAIAAGGDTICAIVSGDVYCWGDDTFAQCGFSSPGVGPSGSDSGVDGGGPPFSSPPRKIAGLPRNIVAIDVNSAAFKAAAHACAISSTGAAYCWGDLTYEELGDGEPSPAGGGIAATPTPVLVQDPSASFTAIRAGDFHTCAITSAGGGTEECWGSNGNGELGVGTNIPSSTPSLIHSIANVTSIAAGNHHSCAVANGRAYCWGSNSYGEIGNGTVGAIEAPTLVAIDAGVTQIAGKFSTFCAITTGGGIRCWGRNDTAQVGDGTGPALDGGVLLPVTVAGFPW